MKTKRMFNFAIGFVGFSVASVNQMTAPLVAVYANEYLHATIHGVGLIVSAFHIASASSKVPIGILTLGSVKRTAITFVASSFMCLLSLFAYALAMDPTSFCLGRLTHGLGFAMFAVSGLTLSSLMSSGGSRLETIGTYTTGLALGFAAGPAFALVSVATVGIRNTFLIAAIFPILGFVVSNILVWKTLAWKTASLDGRINSKTHIISGISRERRFRLAFLAFLALGFLYSIIVAYAPIYARSFLDFAEQQIIFLFLGYSLFMAAIRLVIGRIIRRLGKERLVMLGLLNAAVWVIVVASTHSQHLFMIAFALIGLSHGIVFPTTALMISDVIKPAELVLANAVYLVAFDLGSIAGPNLGSFIASGYGIAPALAVSSIPMLLVAFVVGLEANRLRHEINK